MKCPLCGVEWMHVVVYSQCRQMAELDGDKIKNYGPVEAVLETLG